MVDVAHDGPKVFLFDARTAPYSLSRRRAEGPAWKRRGDDGKPHSQRRTEGPGIRFDGPGLGRRPGRLRSGRRGSLRHRRRIDGTGRGAALCQACVGGGRAHRPGDRCARHRRRRGGAVRRSGCGRAGRGRYPVRENLGPRGRDDAFQRQDSRRGHRPAAREGGWRQHRRLRHGHHAAEQLQRPPRFGVHRGGAVPRHRGVDRGPRGRLDRGRRALLRPDRLPHAHHRGRRRGSDRCAHRQHGGR